MIRPDRPNSGSAPTSAVWQQRRRRVIAKVNQNAAAVAKFDVLLNGKDDEPGLKGHVREIRTDMNS